MASRFYNYALKNYQAGNITEETLDKYVASGLITTDEKIAIMEV